MLTLDGRALLEDRATRLREHRVPTLRAATVDSPDDEAAQLHFDRALAELDELEATLDVAGRIPVAKSDPSTVELGDLVLVEFPGPSEDPARIARVRLVHPIEAPLGAERISLESPLAQALVGARVGQRVIVHPPSRRHHVRVLAAVRPNPPPGSRQSQGAGLLPAEAIKRTVSPASRSAAHRAPPRRG
jgi:transcription elongation GreA/GreB family factor